MRELPIIFTKENRLASVRKVNPKIMTRRVIIPQPTIDKSGNLHYNGHTFGQTLAGEPHFENLVICKSRYQVGDLLYMKEPYQIKEISEFGDVGGLYLDDKKKFYVEFSANEMDKFDNRKRPYGKTSARFMYKNLARHWFEVMGVKCERLQDISYDDVIAEGVDVPTCVFAYTYKRIIRRK